jgi:hypothetical protein
LSPGVTQDHVSSSTTLEGFDVLTIDLICVISYYYNDREGYTHICKSVIRAILILRELDLSHILRLIWMIQNSRSAAVWIQTEIVRPMPS